MINLLALALENGAAAILVLLAAQIHLAIAC